MTCTHAAIGSNPISTVDQLEDLLSEPTEAAVKTMAHLKGDVIVLGVAGKMGPTLARMVRRASDLAGVKRRVIGVARFSTSDTQQQLEAHGIETIRADLLKQHELDSLPDAPNIVAMTGMKFGSTGQESLTWAMNSYLPGMICQRYRHSKIVAFSTGNIYGLTPVAFGGSREGDPLNPVGEYAMSCLGRERMYEHFSRTLEIPMALIRLNYATELRYGVLVDLAQHIAHGETIDLSMGHLNAIWQADANAMSLIAFDHLSVPPLLLNVAGPELLSVRRASEELGRLIGMPPQFKGVEATDALLSNGQFGHRICGFPRVGAEQMIRWIADWTKRGGATLGKPTHFEARDGKF